MFYAMRHQEFLDPMPWGDEVLQFYQDVETWNQEQDPIQKKVLYAQLIVKAFRLRSRTLPFLRGRMSESGKLDFGSSNKVSTDPRGDYAVDNFMPYEQVRILFTDILKQMYVA